MASAALVITAVFEENIYEISSLFLGFVIFAIPLIVGILVCATAVGVKYAHRVYDDSIPTVGESEDLLYKYRPYLDDTMAVSLDAPSAFTIAENLPRMDGATALYPIYASFAKAVYPMSNEAEQNIIDETVVCRTTTEAYERIVTGEADIIFVAGPSEEQEAFAEKCGLHRTYISAIECYRRSIALENVQRIADALEIEAYKLFLEDHVNG